MATCGVCWTGIFVLIFAASSVSSVNNYLNNGHHHRIRRIAPEAIPVPIPPSSTTPQVKLQPIPTISTVTSKLSKHIPTTEPPIHNLGVNGSGQRMHYDMSENPVQSSTLRPPTVLNITAPSHDTTIARDSSSVLPINETESALDDVVDNVDKNSDEIKKDLKNYTNSVKEDSHIFYTSKKIDDVNVGHRYWVNLSTDHPKVRINQLLSKSHRRAETIKLSFEFPFYGHPMKTLTLATGGFIYTGDYIHSWLAATQYIAPLMANFDTSLYNDSYVKYMDNGTALTVLWENVALKDRPKDGNFTFQATLHENGDIIFVYKSVPFFIETIEDNQHPVKVGVSDAYITDRTIYQMRRKTIYEYHRVSFKQENIKNWTTIYIKALPTCLDYHDCSSCLSSNLTNFTCVWCPATNRCSSGLDRHRQDWLSNKCSIRNVTGIEMCSHPYRIDQGQVEDSDTSDKMNKSPQNKLPVSQVTSDAPHTDHVGVSGIIAILFLVAMVLGLSFWIFYAYRNPHTTSGQILIRYRPSQWRWRRGEARYTAATIHM